MNWRSTKRLRHGRCRRQDHPPPRSRSTASRHRQNREGHVCRKGAAKRARIAIRGPFIRKTLMQNRIPRSALLGSLLSISLVTCSTSADEQSEPSRTPSVERAGITLVLLATHASNRCCRIVTVNPGRAMIVFCSVLVFDPMGRLLYSGFIPHPPRGHSRPSGFEALPGRHSQGMFELPIDLARDSYRAPCRPAAWHGSAPI
jgi:hypothetical protein